MPEISFSLKDIAEVVSSVAKAFDTLYSTLRKVAMDGWSGIEFVIDDIKTRTDERRIRSLIRYLRRLQLTKVDASLSIIMFMEELPYRVSLSDRAARVTSAERRAYIAYRDDWRDIERQLTEVISESAKITHAMKYEYFKNLEIPTVLGDKFPILFASMSSRQHVIGKLLDRKPTSSGPLNMLVELLDKEARLIGQCADLLTDFVEIRRTHVC
jgi:hypothetical protein